MFTLKMIFKKVTKGFNCITQKRYNKYELVSTTAKNMQIIEKAHN